MTRHGGGKQEEKQFNEMALRFREYNSLVSNMSKDDREAHRDMLDNWIGKAKKERTEDIGKPRKGRVISSSVVVRHVRKTHKKRISMMG